MPTVGCSLPILFLLQDPQLNPRQTRLISSFQSGMTQTKWKPSWREAWAAFKESFLCRPWRDTRRKTTGTSTSPWWVTSGPFVPWRISGGLWKKTTPSLMCPSTWPQSLGWGRMDCKLVTYPTPGWTLGPSLDFWSQQIRDSRRIYSGSSSLLCGDSPKHSVQEYHCLEKLPRKPRI